MTNEHMAVVMAWLAQRVMKAEGFILEQAPDVIQQIITMDFVQALSVALCLAMAVPFLLALLWLVWCKSEKADEECRWAARAVSTCVIGVIVCSMLCFSVVHSIKAARIHCAPKAYLLERVGILK